MNVGAAVTASDGRAADTASGTDKAAAPATTVTVRLKVGLTAVLLCPWCRGSGTDDRACPPIGRVQTARPGPHWPSGTGPGTGRLPRRSQRAQPEDLGVPGLQHGLDHVHGGVHGGVQVAGHVVA